MISQSRSDEVRELRLELQRQQAHLRKITEQVTPEQGGGRRLGDDDGPVKISKAKIERLAKDLGRLQKRQAAAQSRASQADRLLMRANDWLASLPPHVEIVDHIGEP